MKRYKRIVLLAVVLVIAVAAALIASQVKEKKEEIKAAGDTFLTLPADTVTALSWQAGDTELAFHKGDTWLWDGDDAFPVDEEKIADLLGHFEDMAAAFIIEDVEDYGQYGLTDPVCTIQVTAGDAVTTVKLGAYSTLDQQRYVDIGDGKVYLVADDPFEDYDTQLPELIKNDAIPALADPASFTVSGAAELSASHTESGDSYCPEDVYFTADGKPLDTDLVNSWLNKLAGLSLTDYVTYNATPEELAEYGLDTPDLTVTVTPKEGDPVTLELSQVIPEGAESQEETSAYVRVNGSQIVYPIAPGDYTTASQAGYDDLRHKELFTPAFDTVTGIDVTLEGTTYALTVAQDEDGNPVWALDGQTTETAVTGVQTALEALTASSFTDQEPTGQQEIALTIRLSDEAHPELTMSLTRLDGSLCAAVLNGVPTCTVSRSAVVDLIEAVNAIVLG